jgi:hypothetical protein
MDFEFVVASLDVEDTASGLPIDWFVANGSVHEQRTIFLDNQ